MKKCAICKKTSTLVQSLVKLRGKYNPTAKRRKYPNLQWTRLPSSGKRVLACNMGVLHGDSRYKARQPFKDYLAIPVVFHAELSLRLLQVVHCDKLTNNARAGERVLFYKEDICPRRPVTAYADAERARSEQLPFKLVLYPQDIAWRLV